jgi:hypothetical protein
VIALRRTALWSAALIAGAAHALGAQSLRTLTMSRERTSEQELNVSVDFAAGRFTLRPLAGRGLFTESLTFDEDNFMPKAAYEPASHRLSLGLSTHGHANVSYGRRNPQVLDVALTPNVPLDLNLRFGAVEADIELGGMAITSAIIETGASASDIRFSEPNRVACSTLSMHAGAAAFNAKGLGNSRCEQIELKGGVGDLTMDFSGNADVEETHAKIEVGLGALKLLLPRDVGVAITVNKFLASFDAPGLVKRGSTYYSSNYESADKKLIMDVDTAFGSIAVQWIDR